MTAKYYKANCFAGMEPKCHRIYNANEPRKNLKNPTIKLALAIVFAITLLRTM